MRNKLRKLCFVAFNRFSKIPQYYKFLECKPKSSNSWLWKGLLKTRVLLSKGICYQIFNDISINVWSQPWIPTMENFTSKPLQQMNEVFPLLKVYDMIIDNSCSWNTLKMQTLSKIASLKFKKFFYPWINKDNNYWSGLQTIIRNFLSKRPTT